MGEINFLGTTLRNADLMVRAYIVKSIPGVTMTYVAHEAYFVALNNDFRTCKIL